MEPNKVSLILEIDFDTTYDRVDSSFILDTTVASVWVKIQRDDAYFFLKPRPLLESMDFSRHILLTYPFSKAVLQFHFYVLVVDALEYLLESSKDAGEI